MLFNTAAFGLFLLLVVSVDWAIRSQSIRESWRRRLRLTTLLAASYYFYACWDVRFLLLIGAVTLIDYLAARIIERIGAGRLRLQVVAVTVGLNLGLLGFWKYTDFFLRALGPVFALAHSSAGEPLGLLLPVGISFFTFQGLSYVIDVHRGQIAAERSLFRFALFIAFFPQLVAGPIVRASQLLPALERPITVDGDRFGRGVLLMLVGLAKKVVLADYLAANIVDRVFDLPGHYSSLEVLAAIYGYALQIYGDFSGYTDIAIGAALLLGVALPKNFDLPYRADGLRDFWRRWHISLSTWLRDYLYISLGGSRGGRLATQRNLLITMVLGGLWHGASYNFVIWGTLHGLALAVGRSLEVRRQRRRQRGEAGRRLPAWLRVLLTFHLVCALWVFFRADTLEAALSVFVQLTSLVPGTENLSWPVLALIAAGLFAHYFPRRWYRRFAEGFVQAPAFTQAATIVAVLYAVQVAAASGATPFIYFQF